MKLKKIIAREGLALLVAIFIAWHMAQTNGLKSFMMDIRIVTPRPNQADAVLQEATTAGFWFILIVGYGVVRFIPLKGRRWTPASGR
ncbi:MAG: hypothetical protein WCI77_07725 [Candidatus Omnitrophota bacterium]